MAENLISTTTCASEQNTISRLTVSRVLEPLALRVVAVPCAQLARPSSSMEFLSQTYVALRGPTGAPQSAQDTIPRLADRLAPTTLLADRRAAVLSLKTIARQHKALVGECALPGLLGILQNDAKLDPDIGRAALETLATLCDTHDADWGARPTGAAHVDIVLKTPDSTHALIELLGAQDMHVRLAAVMLLIALLHARLQVVQGYFLNAPVGPSTLVGLLDERDEGRPGDDHYVPDLLHKSLILIRTIIQHSPQIQKILAFEGIFERLFALITRQGGLDPPSRDNAIESALQTIVALLSYNTSNQSYLRETALPRTLCTLLYFNPSVTTQTPDQPAPQEFALQFWAPDKETSAALVLEAVGLLLGSSGGLHEGPAFARMLIELALASNAPTSLKVHALCLLPPGVAQLLPVIPLTPYLPVPGTGDAEWDRLESTPAVDALLELVIHGEYGGSAGEGERRGRAGMELRIEGVGVFENFLRQDGVREAIVEGMLPPPPHENDPIPRSPMTPLLYGLVIPPRSPPDRSSTTTLQFAAILFAHLIRHAPRSKALALQILPPSPTSLSPSAGTFVPADGPSGQPLVPEDDEDEAQGLLQLLTEHLSLAFLSRSREGVSRREEREWDRVVVAYLVLLAQWLWEDARAVRVFLESGGLGVLVEQLNQPSETDVLVPGLCAFLLGVCYEFNREPGEITRRSIHAILSRLGPDVLLSRMARPLRDDPRVKSVAPDTWLVPCTTEPTYEGETELWADWASVDFWKSGLPTVQRSIVAEPDAPPAGAAQSGEESLLVSSLRDVVARQAAQIAELQARAPAARVDTFAEERAALRAALDAETMRRAEVEKEQEDLLVLLDEMNTKRARDKERMRAAGMEVSEDEAEDEDEDEDDEE